MTRDEQETVIRHDREGWHAWSCVPKDIRLFEKQGWEMVGKDEVSASFAAPEDSVRVVRKRQYTLTDEQRKARTKRLIQHANSKP